MLLDQQTQEEPLLLKANQFFRKRTRKQKTALPLNTEKIITVILVSYSSEKKQEIERRSKKWKEEGGNDGKSDK